MKRSSGLLICDLLGKISQECRDMKRSRSLLVWALLGLCAATVLGAMTALTRSVLDAGKTRAEAEAKADLEERTRLALWRLDSEGASVLLAENRAAPGDYQSGAVVANRDPAIYLHFSGSNNDPLSSPELHPPAEPGAREKFERLKFLLRVHPLPLENGEVLTCALAEGEASWNAIPKEALSQKNFNTNILQSKGGVEARKEQVYLENANGTERAQRAKVVDQALENTKQSGQARIQQQETPQPAPQELQQVVPLNEITIPITPARAEIVDIGQMRAVWIGGELFLLRQIRQTLPGLPSQIRVVQGAWVDAAVLRTRLLDEVRDLLPAGNLVPVAGADSMAAASAEDPLALVSFPFRLERNESPPPLTVGIGRPLAVAWAAVIMALAASAVLVGGILRLSERRASFVSAVTHELRTPLTTFQLYSDMLHSGAVKEEKRGDYFRTLQREASRLSHLVENVLAFSRIERGSARATPREVAVGRLVEPMLQRFGERLLDAGLSLQADLSAPAWQAIVKADVAATEHVLFNLIDNAAKYAAGSSPPEVHLEAAITGRYLELRVRDHGTGISANERRRVFRAFHKSAAAAAESRPGVGLGLSLSRRLARANGGDLQLADTEGGACFILTLPLAVK
ncbi:sensor histidine kinase [Luteolibacter soli]|uniref:histidine kinase n=1 Tax=Luteolibacter soli TaxID=3135280 RepID=A0ABU9AW20_9BACT